MATPALSANPGSGRSGGSRERALPGSGSESGRILPFPTTSATARSRHEFAQPQIQRIALRWPAYGYRRVHAELLRQGWSVNHKRILRLMRADNLLCLRRRKFLLLTTDSQHGLPIYPNVAEEMLLTSIDQLWVADITYIRLQVEFVCLAVLLDAFSRRCIGGALRRSLEAALVLEALRMGLTRRHPRPGLVHHSDRGVQYASRDYTALLQQHGIRISMSRLATPYDNAQAESFIKTLKYEEVYRAEYRNLEEAKAWIGKFLEKIYNQQRLHSALGYRPPRSPFAVHPALPSPRHQSCALQHALHPAVAECDLVLAPQLLVKMPQVQIEILLPVQFQHPLHHRRRNRFGEGIPRPRSNSPRKPNSS